MGDIFAITELQPSMNLAAILQNLHCHSKIWYAALRTPILVPRIQILGILAKEKVKLFNLLSIQSEVEFVHPVSAGGSVKFLPAV